MIKKILQNIASFIKHYKLEIVFFFLAVTPRFILMIIMQYHFGTEFYTEAGTADTVAYLKMADGVLQGHGFEYFGTVSALRTPIYPLFITFFKLLHLPVLFIVIFQNILAGINVILLYYIGKLFFSDFIGKIGAILFAVEPYIMQFPNLIMTETLFITFLLLSVLSFGKWLTKNNLILWPIVTGIFLGLTMLTRPTVLHLAFIFSIFAIFKLWSTLRWTIIKPICLFLFTFFLVLLPWNLRNYYTFGVFKLTNVYSTAVLYLRILPIAEAEERGVDYHTAMSILESELPNKIPNFSSSTFENTFEYNKIIEKEAIAKLTRHFPAVVKYFISSLLPFGVLVSGYGEIFNYIWPNWKNSDVNFTKLVLDGNYQQIFDVLLHGNLFKIVLFAGVVFWFSVYVFIIFGSIIALKNKSKYKFALLFISVLSILFIMLSVGPPVHVRYRSISYAFLFLLVGFCVETLKTRKNNNILYEPKNS